MDYPAIRDRVLRPEHTGAPAELTGDPRRAFVRTVPCSACDGSGTQTVVWDGYEEWGCDTCDVTGTAKDAPVDAEPGAEHVAAIADCPAFRDAEAAARAVAAALVPWGHRPAERIVWRVGVGRDPKIGAYYHHVLPEEVDKALDGFFRARKDELAVEVGLGSLGDGQPAYQLIMRDHALAHARLATAARLGLRYPDDVPAGVAGRPVAEVPDLFTPLLDVWRTGFAPERFTDGEIRLYAPRPDAVVR